MGKGKKKPPVEELVVEKKLYLEEQYLNCFLKEKTFIKELVPLPPDIEMNEWLATHTLVFFNHVNLLYGCISELCTTATCPTMNAPGATYLWQEDKSKKTKLTITAPQYIDYVMTYVQKQVYDDALFPSKYGQTFPSTFLGAVKRIIKLLFHVQAHMFYAHYKDFINFELHLHLNTVFMDFMLFSQEFNLLDVKETVPLDDLIQAMGLLDSTPSS